MSLVFLGLGGYAQFWRLLGFHRGFGFLIGCSEFLGASRFSGPCSVLEATPDAPHKHPHYITNNYYYWLLLISIIITATQFCFKLSMSRNGWSFMQSRASGCNKMEVYRLGLRMNTFLDFSCFWHYLCHGNLPLLQQDIYQFTFL